MQCQLNPVLIKASELSSALQFLREKCETYRKSEVRLSPQGTVGAEEPHVGGNPCLCGDSVFSLLSQGWTEMLPLTYSNFLFQFLFFSKIIHLFIWYTLTYLVSVHMCKNVEAG